MLSALKDVELMLRLRVGRVFFFFVCFFLVLFCCCNNDLLNIVCFA